MTEFEFDCPQYFDNLSIPIKYDINSEIDDWFIRFHECEVADDFDGYRNYEADETQNLNVAKMSTHSVSSHTKRSGKALESKPMRLSRSRSSGRRVSSNVFSTTRTSNDTNKLRVEKVDISESNTLNVASSFISMPNRAISKIKSSAPLSSMSAARGSNSFTAQRNNISKVTDAKKSSKISDSKTSLNSYQVHKSSAGVSEAKGNRCSTTAYTTKKSKIEENDIADDREMLCLLKKHNRRFVPVPTYEPSRHSVREVRFWEKKTGRLWSKLSAQDRELVNDEITKIKKDGNIVTK